MDKKKLRNDIILIASLLLVAVAFLIVILATRKSNNLVAKVYVQNKVVEVVNLSSPTKTEFDVEGLHGTVHVSVKNGAIAITESNCPHQDCVHVGYVDETNRPIICAYNGVYIVIEGSSNTDVVIG
ncbi:MAG: NusG domain II-containing protein [Bacilli bacterium]|nr:NusG domain II-containing protein [Bacilli bacterium]